MSPPVCRRCRETSRRPPVNAAHHLRACAQRAAPVLLTPGQFPPGHLPPGHPAATTAAATWLAYLELLETTVDDICAKFEANPLSIRAASSGEVQARRFRARGSMDITAAAAATTAAATWLAYLELLETTVGDICAKFEANPLSIRAASSGEVQARRFRARGSMDITAAAAATTAAATWLAYLELLETTWTTSVPNLKQIH